MSDKEMLQYLVTILRENVAQNMPMSPGRMQGILNTIESNHRQRRAADDIIQRWQSYCRST